MAYFILDNIEPILQEWEDFARSLGPGAEMTRIQLRDDAESILRATAADMQSRQSPEQQENKSKGNAGAAASGKMLDNVSDLHGAERVGSGFCIAEVVSEYRALRAAVVRRWRQEVPYPNANDIDDLTRFHECLDQLLARGVNSYSKRIDSSRQMFLAILSHDLRNPLTAIRMAAFAVSKKSKEDAAFTDAVSLINTSTDAMLRLVCDMIDFSSSALGRVMPLRPEPLRLDVLCREVVACLSAAQPGRLLRLHLDGEVDGVWDASRMRQILFNLVTNALQHGAPDGEVTLAVSSETRHAAEPPEDQTVAISVHNEGAPIPPSMLSTIFDPLTRYETKGSAANRRPGSVGLGLYIVQQIVVAKGGSVSVKSTAEDGTTFTVQLPRYLALGGKPFQPSNARSTFINLEREISNPNAAASGAIFP